MLYGRCPLSSCICHHVSTEVLLGLTYTQPSRPPHSNSSDSTQISQQGGVASVLNTNRYFSCPYCLNSVTTFGIVFTLPQYFKESGDDLKCMGGCAERSINTVPPDAWTTCRFWHLQGILEPINPHRYSERAALECGDVTLSYLSIASKGSRCVKLVFTPPFSASWPSWNPHSCTPTCHSSAPLKVTNSIWLP